MMEEHRNEGPPEGQRVRQDLHLHARISGPLCLVSPSGGIAGTRLPAFTEPNSREFPSAQPAQHTAIRQHSSGQSAELRRSRRNLWTGARCKQRRVPCLTESRAARSRSCLLRLFVFAAKHADRFGSGSCAPRRIQSGALHFTHSRERLRHAKMMLSSFRQLSRKAARHARRDLSTIKQVGVVGLGLMGHGVAQVTAMATSPEYSVVAIDGSQESIDAGKQRIDQSLSKMLGRKVKKGLITEEDAQAEKTGIASRISYASDVSYLADCDLVIEAITENPDIKFGLFKDLARVTRPDCILASNTSSLSITEIAEASGRPSHVVGLHFFNPVQLMRLVEVVRCDATDSAVFEECKAWAKTVGKHPVSCVDTPGFIVNRLLVPGLAQGMLMYDRGDGSVEDIDKSMELGAGHPMGPLTLADYVGLDICLSILEGWVHKYPDEPSFVVPESLRQKVAAGKLGRKSGEGYYLWDGDKRGNVAP